MSATRPRVAIDAHSIGRRATGNETYVRGLLEGLRTTDEVDLRILTDRPASIPLAWRDSVRALRFRHPIPRLLLDLPHAGKRWAADLLHVQYVRPPRSDIPVVTTIHDISFERYPSFFRRGTLLRMRAMIPRSARHSAAVITGSQFSKAELVEYYGLAPERVHVTPYAADPGFRPIPPPAALARVRDMGLPDDYILYVGNLQPRKNLSRLLQAVDGLRRRGIEAQLVIVGQAAWLYADVFAQARRTGLAKAVHFTGYLPSSDLPAVYGRASVFAYPSLFEGFGLPVLEAMACGVPTLTSCVSSLPEVAGDAAVLVEPTEASAIEEGLERILTDTTLRDRLRAAGPLQAARFSWTRCAAETAEVYRSVL